MNQERLLVFEISIDHLKKEVPSLYYLLCTWREGCKWLSLIMYLIKDNITTYHKKHLWGRRPRNYGWRYKSHKSDSKYYNWNFQLLTGKYSPEMCIVLSYKIDTCFINKFGFKLWLTLSLVDKWHIYKDLQKLNIRQQLNCSYS